jgi:hypothetical protein
MKWFGILFFLATLLCFTNDGNTEVPTAPEAAASKMSVAAETPSSPGGPGVDPAPSGAMAGEGPTAPVAPAWPGQTNSMSGMGEIFFAAGTVSADSKALYVIFDKLLMHYSLPELDLKRKVELDIAVAPVNPSISISKDGKYIYVIYNGILYQIDAVEFKIEKRFKITP